MTTVVVPAVDALGLGWVLAALLPGLVDTSVATPPGGVLAVACGTVGYRMLAHLRPRAAAARGALWVAAATVALTVLATTPTAVPPFVEVSLAGCTAAVAGLTLPVSAAASTVLGLQAWYAGALLLTHTDAPDQARQQLGYTAVVALASCATAALVAASLRRSRLRIAGLVAGLVADRRTLRADQARDQARRHARAALHDTVLTTLSAVGAGWLRDTPPADLRAEFRASATALADEQRAEDDVDLVEALRSTAAAPRLARLEIDVVADPGPVTVAPPVVEALRLAVGEALTNVLKHSGVRRAVVEVQADGADHVRATVRDAGQGFRIGTDSQDRLGLKHSVGDRLAAVGGTASTRALPGVGTEVVLTAPCREPLGGPVVPSMWSPTGPRTAGLWVTGGAVTVGLGGLALSDAAPPLQRAAGLVLLLSIACTGVVVARCGRFPGALVAAVAIAAPVALIAVAMSPGGCTTLWSRPSAGALGVLAVGLLLALLRPAGEALVVMSVVVVAYLAMPLLGDDGSRDCLAAATSLASMHCGEVVAAVLVMASLRARARTAHDDLLSALADEDAAQDDTARRSERARLLPVVRAAVARTLEQLATGDLDPHDAVVRHRCSRDARLIRSLLADGESSDEVVTTLVTRVLALREAGIDLAIQGGVSAGVLDPGRREAVAAALDRTTDVLLAGGWRGEGQVTLLITGGSLVLTVVAEGVPDDLTLPLTSPTEGTWAEPRLDLVDGTLWSTYRVGLPGGDVIEDRGGAP